MSQTKTPAELEAMQEAMQRLVNGCLRPNAPAIAVIGFTGDVAVVLHEPGETTRAKARTLGWDGKSEVFRLGAEGKSLLAGSTEPSDAGISAWLARKFEPAAPVARIYVLTGDGSLLMNFSPYGGWAVEPPAKAAGKPN
jgi:hypothetical protein